jgi:predicted thioredoxin/glutaredoxin
MSMVSKRLARHSLAMAADNVQTGVDAALTIAARTQDMLSFGRPMEKAREAQLMVQEKVDAAIAGVFAAQAAWSAFMLKAAFGGVRTPNDLSIGLAGIANAAARPARRAVRANARRLTGTRTLS